jgi:hypothetical protein
MDAAARQGIAEAYCFPQPPNLNNEPLANPAGGNASYFDAHGSRNIAVSLLSLAIVKINDSIQEHGGA